MKTVFLNPFLPTDLNEKVTSVSFKIGSFDYVAKYINFFENGDVVTFNAKYLTI